MQELIAGQQTFTRLRELVDKTTRDFAEKYGISLADGRGELAIIEITLTKDDSLVFRCVPKKPEEGNTVIRTKGEAFSARAVPGHSTIFREL
jgi:hypothetical protein